MSWSEELLFQCFLIMILILKINPICALTVLALYSGVPEPQNGKHSSVSDSSNISAVSCMAFQVFDVGSTILFRASCHRAGNLSNLPIFITFIKPFSDYKDLQQHGSILELSAVDLNRSCTLQNVNKQLQAGFKQSKKRGRNSPDDDGEA